MSFLSAFIAFSTIPELAKRIKIFFALAPIITVKYTQSPLKKLTALSRRIVKVCDFSKFQSVVTKTRSISIDFKRREPETNYILQISETVIGVRGIHVGLLMMYICQQGAHSFFSISYILTCLWYSTVQFNSINISRS